MNAALLKKDARLVLGIVVIALAVVAAVLIAVAVAPMIPGLTGVVGWNAAGVPTMSQRLGGVTQALLLACVCVPYLTAVMLSIGEKIHGSGELATSVPATDRTKVLSKVIILSCVSAGTWTLYVICDGLDGFARNGWDMASMAGVVVLSAIAGFAAAALARTFMRCLLLALVLPQVAALVSTPVTAIVLRISAACEGMSYTDHEYQDLWPQAWRWGVVAAGLGLVAVLAWATLPMMAGRRSSLRLFPIGVWALIAALGGAVAGSTFAAFDGGYPLSWTRQRRASVEHWRETLANMPRRDFWRTAFNQDGNVEASRWEFMGLVARVDPRTAIDWFTNAPKLRDLDSNVEHAVQTIIEKEVARRLEQSPYEADTIVADMVAQSQPLDAVFRAASMLPRRQAVELAARMLAERDSEADQVAAIGFLAGRRYSQEHPTWCEIVEMARAILRYERDTARAGELKQTDRELLESAIARAGAPRPGLAITLETMGNKWDAESLACLRNGVPDTAERK